MSIISAGTSNTTSIIYTGDTTGNLAFQINGTTEAMRITSAGRVGIGISAPTFALDVVGNTLTNGVASRNMLVQSNDAAGAGIGGGIAFGGYFNGTTDVVNDFAGIQGFKENSTANDYAGALRFTTRVNGGLPTERMRIASGGNVGIGTSSPAQRLHVVGGQSYVTGASGAGAYSRWYNNAQTSDDFQVGQGWSSASDNIALLNNNANAAMIFGTNGTERMRIDSTGRVTMPYQPFFAGSHSNEYATTFTSGSIIPVNNALSNIGNHFNTSTYTFTCPVNGVYEALMSDLSQSASTAALAIYINGNVVARSYWENTRQKGNFCMFYASANDAVTFRVGEGSCNLYGAGGYGRYQIRLLG